MHIVKKTYDKKTYTNKCITKIYHWVSLYFT